MKKYILMVFLCVLVLCVAACGETKPEPTDAPTTQATTEATVPPTTGEKPKVERKVPYSLLLDAAVAIRKEPSLESEILRPMGFSQSLRIVKEFRDDAGEIWGMLDGNQGWIKITGTPDRITRVCPVCGVSEPEVAFPENWQLGMACNDCRETQD